MVVGGMTTTGHPARRRQFVATPCESSSEKSPRPRVPITSSSVCREARARWSAAPTKFIGPIYDQEKRTALQADRLLLLTDVPRVMP